MLRTASLTLFLIVSTATDAAPSPAPILEPNPIPAVGDQSSFLENALYGLLVGSQNRIQQRIAELENKVTRWVSNAEYRMNTLLDEAENRIKQKTLENGVANIEDTITFANSEVEEFVKTTNKIVNYTLRKIQEHSKQLEDNIEFDTSRTLVAGVVRSAIRRVDVIVRAALQHIRDSVTETINTVLRTIYNNLGSLRSATNLRDIRRQIQRLIDYSNHKVLQEENHINEVLYDKYRAVQHEAEPLPAVLNTLLPISL